MQVPKASSQVTLLKGKTPIVKGMSRPNPEPYYHPTIYCFKQLLQHYLKINFRIVDVGAKFVIFCTILDPRDDKPENCAEDIRSFR